MVSRSKNRTAALSTLPQPRGPSGRPRAAGQAMLMLPLTPGPEARPLKHRQYRAVHCTAITGPDAWARRRGEGQGGMGRPRRRGQGQKKEEEQGKDREEQEE